MTADAIARRHGPIFWFLTLLCGFLIMAPTQVSQLDQIARRWTDVLWIASRRLHTVDAHKVKLVYYTLLALYCVWGLIALRVSPNPLVLAIATGVVGIWLHFAGNRAFEVEMDASQSGWLLAWHSLRGATPALAPGAMVQLGLIGLLYTWRHPALTTRTTSGEMR